jgi:hypothetical protein
MVTRSDPMPQSAHVTVINAWRQIVRTQTAALLISEENVTTNGSMREEPEDVHLDEST